MNILVIIYVKNQILRKLLFQIYKALFLKLVFILLEYLSLREF